MSRWRWMGWAGGALVALAAIAPVGAAMPGSVRWQRGIVTSQDDDAHGVAVDSSGNSFVVGTTQGSMTIPQNGMTSYIRQYDSAGNIVWTDQFKQSGAIASNGWAVALDSAGSPLVAGSSGPSYVRKYSSAGGAVAWERTFQGGGAGGDGIYAVTTDAANSVYVGGYTSGPALGPYGGSSDAVLRKYDASGNVLWSKQSGIAGDENWHSLHVDPNGNLIAGGLSGSAGVVQKFDSAGNILWTRTISSPDTDNVFGVSTDPLGNVYATGITNAGVFGNDAFLAKYDPAGNLLWQTQNHYNGGAQPMSIVVDDAGDAYVSGAGSFIDSTFTGPYSDAFVFGFNTDGHLLWTQQFGTGPMSDLGYGIASSPDGKTLWLAGTAAMSTNPPPNRNDGFLYALDVPEPVTLPAVALSLGLASLRRRRHQ